MNQKGFIKDVIIIVLAILLLGGGYFYFSKKPAYAPAENTNQNQIADENKDWKTYDNLYSNSPWKFSIQYPSGWGIFDGFNQDVEATYIQLFPDKNHKLEIALSATDYIDVDLIVSDEKDYYSEYNRIKYGELEWSFGIIKLKGGDSPGIGTAFAGYSVLNNVHIRGIGYSFALDENNNNLEAEYKKVLSTFKFTK